MGHETNKVGFLLADNELLITSEYDRSVTVRKLEETNMDFFFAWQTLVNH
jgi:hypothetical protein